jgi:hypothetical protein
MDSKNNKNPYTVIFFSLHVLKEAIINSLN